MVGDEEAVGRKGGGLIDSVLRTNRAVQRVATQYSRTVPKADHIRSMEDFGSIYKILLRHREWWDHLAEVLFRKEHRFFFKQKWSRSTTKAHDLISLRLCHYCPLWIVPWYYDPVGVSHSSSFMGATHLQTSGSQMWIPFHYFQLDEHSPETDHGQVRLWTSN